MLKRTLVLVLMLLTVVLLAACSARTGEPEDEPAPVAAANVHSNCTKCHYSESPTAAEPGLRANSKPVTGTGPEIILIGFLSELYEPVKLDHKTHAEMGNMGEGCGACHHQTPAVQEKASCKTCHNPKAVMMSPLQPGLKGAYHQQCLKCHQQWSDENNCAACHTPKSEGAKNLTASQGSPKANIRVPYNPESLVVNTAYATLPRVSFNHRYHSSQLSLDCSRCHRQTTCESCHNQEGKATITRSSPAMHNVCLSCHAKARCEVCHQPAVGRS